MAGEFPVMVTAGLLPSVLKARPFLPGGPHGPWSVSHNGAAIGAPSLQVWICWESPGFKNLEPPPPLALQASVPFPLSQCGALRGNGQQKAFP